MDERALEIVTVDDEVQITELIELFIKSVDRKSNIHSFNDPVAAREYLMDNPVDVLITDYKMPMVNGIDLLESVPSHVKKVLISGYVSEIAQDRLERLNAVFFEKPVPMKELRRAVFG